MHIDLDHKVPTVSGIFAAHGTNDTTLKNGVCSSPMLRTLFDIRLFC